jgi:hypothetical protein
VANTRDSKSFIFNSVRIGTAGWTVPEAYTVFFEPQTIAATRGLDGTLLSWWIDLLAVTPYANDALVRKAAGRPVPTAALERWNSIPHWLSIASFAIRAHAPIKTSNKKTIFESLISG